MARKINRKNNDARWHEEDYTIVKSETEPGDHAFPFQAVPDSEGEFDVDEGLTAREYAAIHLCIPESGRPWLDEMIKMARRDKDMRALAASPEQLIFRKALSNRVEK